MKINGSLMIPHLFPYLFVFLICFQIRSFQSKTFECFYTIDLFSTTADCEQSQINDPLANRFFQTNYLEFVINDEHKFY